MFRRGLSVELNPCFSSVNRGPITQNLEQNQSFSISIRLFCSFLLVVRSEVEFGATAPFPPSQFLLLFSSESSGFHLGYLLIV